MEKPLNRAHARSQKALVVSNRYVLQLQRGDKIASKE